MIIGREEYLELGFGLDEKSTPLFEGCEKRAEYVVNGLSNGRAGVIAGMGGTAAELVKEAVGFQTAEIIKEELAYSQTRQDSTENSSSADKSEQRVSIGDFSYSTGASSSSSKSSASKSSAVAAVEPLNVGRTVIRLLRAAGCLYCGTEVIE